MAVSATVGGGERLDVSGVGVGKLCDGESWLGWVGLGGQWWGGCVG